MLTRILIILINQYFLKIRKLDKLKNYYLPNFLFILNKKPELGSNVTFTQRTKLFGDGMIKIGKGSTFGYRNGGGFYRGEIELQTRSNEAKLVIGEYVKTNNNIFIAAAGRVYIGSNTLIGRNVTIMDFEAHGFKIEDRKKIGLIGEIIIGGNSWIGNNAIILRDTILGDNTIVAAGAVVKGVFESNVILGGVPARIIKKLND